MGRKMRIWRKRDLIRQNEYLQEDSLGGREEEFEIIDSVREIPAPCRGCPNLYIGGYAIKKVDCIPDYPYYCQYEEDLVWGNFAMISEPLEVFKGVWNGEIRFPEKFFKIIREENNNIIFELDGSLYCYMEGSCVKLSEQNKKAPLEL
jgi:hypothetical protein